MPTGCPQGVEVLGGGAPESHRTKNKSGETVVLVEWDPGAHQEVEFPGNGVREGTPPISKPLFS